jgi:hypothetical protein
MPSNKLAISTQAIRVLRVLCCCTTLEYDEVFAGGVSKFMM